MLTVKKIKRKRRHQRVRGKIAGTAHRPRLFVFKSNNHIYATIINDASGVTLASVSDKSVKNKVSSNNIEMSKLVGEEIAKVAIKAGYSSVVFDRGGYKYHGKVKALAESARSAGLKF